MAVKASNPEPIVVEFKTGKEGEFQKPDHDPMGETCAAAAHCSTSCDNCGKSGLVVDTVMEAASGMFDGVEKPVHCAECGK